MLRVRKKLGEMLVEAGLIDQNQLMGSVAEAKKANLKLGQVLVRNGIVRENQIVDAVSRQLRVNIYHPARYPVDLSLAGLLDADFAQKYQVVPLQKRGALLLVATTDPMDLDALDQAEFMTNCEIEPLICTEHEYNSLFGTLYGKFSNVNGVLSEVQDMEGTAEKDEEPESIDQREIQVNIIDMAGEQPVIRLVNSILAQAVRESASDIHISPEKDHTLIRFRIDGKLQVVPSPPRHMFLPVVSRIKILSNMDISISRIPQDGRFTFKVADTEINVRASTLPTVHGENVVLRLLNMSAGIYNLDLLGMSEVDLRKLKPLISKPHGMILSTGPTGSGKSTSLYSILKEVNTPDINIVTLEDPVEYRVGGIRQIQLNRRAGMTFASGLRAVLRQDPDVIMVGEIRDAETASIAVQSALTGHRVLSTVHTNDAAGAITRFIDMGVEPFLVASTMLVSFAQRLVRRICPYCAERYQPSNALLEMFGIDPLEEIDFKIGKGCYNCMNTGYKGRIGLFEVLEIDEMVQEMALERRSSSEITRMAIKEGKLKTLREDAADKIRAGVTTADEAVTTVMA